MVRIINYLKRQSEDGKEFYVLEISGGIEMVKSQETGQYYATSKKTTLPSTFDEQTCKALIGTEMPGKVERQEVEPYTYIVKETGEELILHHRWVYVDENPNTQQESAKSDKLEADANAFSTNGHYVEVEA
ncbi:hypothetical protein [Mesonia maritima]|uniref:Phage protein n=1 Tax=Mesonia maritima TaxID=1793873 RepID=A0ABU1K2S6_9FLAO|nr:hypothetical protein [Mesonia maritima]MDR6299910.1 hypothetical protein [Mesonia maritima]